MSEKSSGISGIARPPSRIGKPKTMPSAVPSIEVSRLSDRRPSVSLQKPATPSVQPVSESGFNIGEIVAIPGGSVGKLVFLAETKFAKGEWAGVVLNEPSGKNNGSVDGVSYFNCPQNHGVFLKPMKLVKLESSQPVPVQTPIKASPGPIRAVSTTFDHGRTTPRPTTPGPSQVQLRNKPGLTPALDVKVGDTVYVNGQKEGIAHYVGDTDFATGTWVGVVLPDKSGKNDGSVNGKIYFKCEMGFGLFSPLSKISKTLRPPSTLPKRPASAVQEPMTQKLSVTEVARRRGSTSGALMERNKHGGSSGSLSSLSSASSAANKPGHLPLSHAPQIAHDLLREAEIRENQLRNLVDQADKEKMELSRQLEEERRKLEDLHFRMEEESILKGELLSERNKYKHKFDSAQGAIAEYHDQLEELRKKYYDLEFQLQEQSIDSDSGVSSLDQDELREKERVVKRLEDELCSLKNDNATISSELRSSKEIVTELTKENSKSVRVVEDLKMKLTAKESLASEIGAKYDETNAENQRLQQEVTDQLSTTQFLRDEKTRLEGTISSLMGASGDSDSKASVLASDSREKQIQIEKLEASVQAVTAEKSQLQSRLYANRAEFERELASCKTQEEQNRSELQEQVNQLSQVVSTLESDLKTAQTEKLKIEADLVLKIDEVSLLSSQISEHSKASLVLEEKLAKQEISRKELLADVKLGKVNLDKLSDENRELKSKVSEISMLEAELSSSVQAKSKADEDLKTCTENLKSLQSRSETLEKQLAELGTTLVERDNQVKQFQSLVEEKAKADTEISSLKKQYETVMTKYSDTKKELTKSNEKCKRADKLEEELNAVNSSATEYKNRLEILIEDYTSLESWHEDLKAKYQLTQGLTEENDKLKSDLFAAQEAVMAKDSSILQYKDSVSKYKAELDVAVKKTSALESSDSGGVSLQIRSERDSLQKQVDFLNSVIVDLQNKNSYLLSKSQGDSGVASARGGLRTPDGSDELNDFDSPLNNVYHKVRAFCDICDEFDLHNTEECPKQTSSDSPPHAYNRGNVSEPRPYCESCEMFGHWTQDCDDDQMF